MERYLKRRISIDDASSSGIASNEIPQSSSIPSVPVEIDLSETPWDPSDRKKIRLSP